MCFANAKITPIVSLLFAVAVCGQTRQPCSVVRVLDGCRVEIESGQIVHLIGIQPFPTNLPALAKATAFLDSLLNGPIVELERDIQVSTDTNRIFGYLWRDSLLVNLDLLRQGLMRVWEDTAFFRHREAFLEAERAARAAQRGNWKADTLFVDTGETATAAIDETVYVTKSGRKYHRGNCRLLSENRIALPLSKARENYTPCRLCIVSATPLEEKTSRRAGEKISTEQCVARTKSGERCKRLAEPGSKYCWQHRRR